MIGMCHWPLGFWNTAPYRKDTLSICFQTLPHPILHWLFPINSAICNIFHYSHYYLLLGNLLISSILLDPLLYGQSPDHHTCSITKTKSIRPDFGHHGTQLIGSNPHSCPLSQVNHLPLCQLTPPTWISPASQNWTTC